MLTHVGDGSWWCGYNGKPWTWSTSADDKFEMKVDPVRRPLMPLRDESIAAAKDIADRYQGEQIFVLNSGGLDSEATLHAFRQANIPVIAVTMVDTKGINAEEVEWAKRYYSRTGFDAVEYMHFDMNAFVMSKEVRALAEQSQTPYASSATYFAAYLECSRRGVVIGGDDPGMYYQNKEWYCYEEERCYSLLKFFMLHDIKGVPGLFWYNSEIRASWISDELFEKLLIPGRSRPESYTSFDPYVKSMLFKKHFGLEPRRKVMWHLNGALVWKESRTSYLTRVWSELRATWLANCLMPTELGEAHV